MRLAHEQHRELTRVARQRASQAPSFETLYRDNHAFVWRCARSLGVADAVLDDVVQDTFVIALRRLDDYDPSRAAPSTWLFSILRNVIRNRARGERRRQQRHARFASWSAAHEESPDAREALGRRLLRDFLDGLDDKRREVFVLAELEGLRAPEIAAALDCNLNTVYSRLRVARERFAEHFGERELPSAAQPSAAQRRASYLAIVGAVELPGAGAGVLGLGAWTSAAGKVAAAVILGALGVVGAARLTGEVEAKPERAERVARASAARTVEARPEPSAAPLLAATEPLDDAIVVEPQPRPRVAPKKPSSPQAPASAIEVLGQARAALDAGQAARALDALDGARWSSSTLAGRARVLEVEALCELGRVDEARRQAARWREAQPEGLVADQLSPERVCAGRREG